MAENKLPLLKVP